MMTKQKILSALAGLTLLAMPVSAFAGHHDHGWRDSDRPFVGHDNGLHRGWFKHAEDRDDQGENEDYGRRGYYQPEYRAPVYRYQHEEPDGDESPRNYWGSDNDYGEAPSWYDAQPPSTYGFSQRQSFLLERRQRAYYTLARMRARGDRHAANRMQAVINRLNAQINNGGRRAYGPPVGYAPPVAYGNGYNPGYGYNNGYGAGYNAYGNNGYGYGGTGNPTVDSLGSLLGPMLGNYRP
jgi:hypothetical protein